MLAAIEIYNKPQIAYRDECFTNLLINAWELLLKAILSKSKQRIYYPKKRKIPYRTYSIQDALEKTRPFFPPAIPFEPVRQNINLLLTFRDNAIHFYNQPEFGVIVYGLAQTSIINYRDLMNAIFGIDMADIMTVSLLPLSFGIQPDPIQFISASRDRSPRNRAVAQFIREISRVTQELEDQSLDTSRFLTVFRANLQSVKKITSADVVVAVGDDTGSEPLLIERRVDPNISHPLRRTEIMRLIGDELNGTRFTTRAFEAIAWKFDWKRTPHLCWRSTLGNLTRYSREVPAMLRRMPRSQIELAYKEYSDHLARSRKRKARRPSSNSPKRTSRDRRLQTQDA
jgi:hypothetical protein